MAAPSVLPVERAVCVVEAGLIGGSLLRAATKAGREVWGTSESEATAAAARADGFDVDTDTDTDPALRRAAAGDALVVLAVPLPALPARRGRCRLGLTAGTPGILPDRPTRPAGSHDSRGVSAGPGGHRGREPGGDARVGQDHAVGVDDQLGVEVVPGEAD